MAVYRFKVVFEDYDDVVREIEIESKQTFEDFHRIIQQSTGYNAEASSSFYVSNDFWIKGEEIAFMPSAKKTGRGVALMENAKLSSFIDDPHQKFYYTYNFDRPYDFHIELIKILLDDASATVYPRIVRSVGDAPKPFGAVAATPASEETSEDFDFLHEEGLNPEDAEDFTEVDDAEGVPLDEDADEFAEEFDDNEHPEEHSNEKDEY
ncbi:IS1096 element passenger TnpR family protein [Mucilaginibacter sp.]|uniref:IS1096 element passenger TnpR family protein n=1 Tax=Mucilaginibacter sp. TaxID=1882438 RepID=UPI003B0031D8